MNELLELRLEVLPGVIKATGSVGPAAEGTDRRSGKAGAGIEKQGVRAEKERRAEQGQESRRKPCGKESGRRKENGRNRDSEESGRNK